MSDKRFLTTRGPVYYAQVAAPRALKGRFRRLVLQSLGTKQLSEAQSRRWAVVNGWKHAFTLAQADESMTAEDIEATAKAEIERLRQLESGHT